MEELKITGNDISPGVFFASAAAGSGIFVGSLNEDVMLSRGGQDLFIGGDRNDRYAFNQGMGSDLIAGETAGGATLFFVSHVLADLHFSALQNDLVIDAIGGSVTVVGYFAGGGNGLDSFVVGFQWPARSVGAPCTGRRQHHRRPGDRGHCRLRHARAGWP